MLKNSVRFFAVSLLNTSTIAAKSAGTVQFQFKFLVPILLFSMFSTKTRKTSRNYIIKHDTVIHSNRKKIHGFIGINKLFCCKE